MTFAILNPYFWLFFTCLVLLMHFYKIYTYISDFPTTPHWPIIGHLMDYMDPYDALPNLTRNLLKSGGFLKQYIGPKKPILLVANKEFVQFLSVNSKYISKGQSYKYLRPWLGDGLVTSEGCKWLSRRRALSSSVMQTALLKVFVEDFDKKSKILIGILEKYENQEIDILPLIKKFSLDVFCENVMGISLNVQQCPTNLTYSKAIDTICESVQRRLVSFFKQYDFFYQFTQMCKNEKIALAKANKMVETIIEKRQNETLKENQIKNMLDVMLDLDIDGKPLSFEDLRDEINTFTFAGHDTSSSSLAFALYEIGQNPHVQEKLLKEQTEIFQDLNFMMTYEKLQKMTYMEWVIKESLRKHTVLPCIAKEVLRDLRFENKKIPAGLHVNIVLHAIHNNPDYFPEPEKFIPERFLKEIDKFTYMPFGLKPRNCIGKNFAMLQMKCVLSNIIRHFEIVKVPEHELKITAKLLRCSTNGIVISMKRRDNK